MHWNREVNCRYSCGLAWGSQCFVLRIEVNLRYIEYYDILDMSPTEFTDGRWFLGQ